ncbi:MAG TPA: aldo/keto reductase, partial [Sphingopyxis sp.]|nr:aldo/keto reductase [Sphingopyxis sp.]
MTDRALGASGLSIRPFVLGGNVFGMTAGREASFAVLDRFVEHGGGMIDTADVYSAWVPGHKGGESESMMGAWLKASGARDSILIATKVGMMPGGLKPDRIREAVQGSLDRLGVDTIDLYFAHKDDPDVPLGEVLGAFAELVDAGIVRAIGASNYSADRLAEALRVADEAGLPRFTAMQPELNLLDRAQYEGALQDLCVAEGLGVVTYFSLASGYLTGKYRSVDDIGRSARGPRVKPYVEGKGPAMLAVMDAIAAETGATLSQIALAWVAAQPAVTAP